MYNSQQLAYSNNVNKRDNDIFNRSIMSRKSIDSQISIADRKTRVNIIKFN